MQVATKFVVTVQVAPFHLSNVFAEPVAQRLSERFPQSAYRVAVVPLEVLSQRATRPPSVPVPPPFAVPPPVTDPPPVTAPPPPPADPPPVDPPPVAFPPTVASATHAIPFPEKPAWHVQVRLPLVLAQVALESHPPFPVRHSSASAHWPVVQANPLLQAAHVSSLRFLTYLSSGSQTERRYLSSSNPRSSQPCTSSMA